MEMMQDVVIIHCDACITLFYIYIGDMVGNARWNVGANYHFDLGYVPDGLE